MNKRRWSQTITILLLFLAGFLFYTAGKSFYYSYKIAHFGLDSVVVSCPCGGSPNYAGSVGITIAAVALGVYAIKRY